MESSAHAASRSLGEISNRASAGSPKVFSPLYIMYMNPSWQARSNHHTAASDQRQNSRGRDGGPSLHNATDATDATHACNGSRGARGSPPPLTSSRCCSYTADMSAAVGGSVLLTKMKMALSEGMVMRFRMTYTNWPTVKSIGMRYLRLSTCAAIGETGVGERG